MKVLFVCRSNVGRSQMGESLYSHLYGGDADSAGTMVEETGQKLKERPDNTTATLIAAMKELDIDMSNKMRTQVTPDMLVAYDKIIVMCGPEVTPDWLANHPNVERWRIKDSVRISLAETRTIRDEIKQLVAAL